MLCLKIISKMRDKIVVHERRTRIVNKLLYILLFKIICLLTPPVYIAPNATKAAVRTLSQSAGGNDFFSSSDNNDCAITSPANARIL